MEKYITTTQRRPRRFKQINSRSRREEGRGDRVQHARDGGRGRRGRRRRRRGGGGGGARVRGEGGGRVLQSNSRRKNPKL
ncbi:MAG: hypothetical protein CMF69_12790 [Magnetovibrio sp.]|nr:hypothetical protein [Magnetovibrio sp.]